MKCLVVYQPYASLIIKGIKDVENRPWKTPYRGPIAILAGKSTHLIECLNSESKDKYWKLVKKFLEIDYPRSKLRGIKPISWHFVPPEFLTTKKVKSANPGAELRGILSIKIPTLSSSFQHTHRNRGTV